MTTTKALDEAIEEAEEEIAVWEAADRITSARRQQIMRASIRLSGLQEARDLVVGENEA